MEALVMQAVGGVVTSVASHLIPNMARWVKRRSVEIKISNNTQNITLRNPRTFFNCGRCSAPLKSELSLCSSDSCHFKGTYPSWGVAGVLVYEAKSFTLAIYFSNPTDKKSFMELGLELSPGKAHRGRLEDTYTRMAHGIYSSSRLEIKFDRITVDESHGTVQVRHRNVKVKATMSNATDSILRVVLKEKEGWREEARAENPCGARQYQK